MSAFDQPFNKSSGCSTIFNDEDGESQCFPQHRLQGQSDAPSGRPTDDLKPSSSGDNQQLQEIDDMLSNAFKSLTAKERQEDLEILFGVGTRQVVEEETFIEASLQQLESRLSQIKNRSVYHMAEQMDPAYVRSRKFRIMFLRGNRYNVNNTADNMLRFFEMKHQLFGMKKLVKDITLEDLDEDDMTALKSGFLQLPDKKDSAGRVTSVTFPGLRSNVTLQNELRMRYYIVMSTVEKEENQLSGIVPIVFSVGDMKDRFGGSGSFEHTKLAVAMPIHVAALHLCTDDVGQYLIQAAILKAIPTKLRSRVRLHFGSQTECLYQLSTYGIPQDILPLDPNTQQISLKRHLEWVDSRVALEKHHQPLLPIASNEQTIINNPSDADVLLGTGKKSNNMGNERLRALVKEYSQAYSDGTKEYRKSLVDMAINSVQESGGRFLKEHNIDGINVVWKEIPTEQSRRTVTQSFRNSYKRRKKSEA